MTLSDLISLFAKNGAIKLYAKTLAENDNSKNQVYFAGAVETLNVFPSSQIFAENTAQGPSFKAKLNFGWLLQDGRVAPAPNAQLILYAQYPEVRFSGFLLGCECAPSKLMADRRRASSFPHELQAQLRGRVLFLGVTADRRVVGFVAPGGSIIAKEFLAGEFQTAFVVFKDVPLPNVDNEEHSKNKLLAELIRINSLGWIKSKQLDGNGIISPCNASQCGGFTLEAELKIPKNSDAEPDFLGWEVKQYAVGNFEKIETSKPITLFTPEPDAGFYRENDFADFMHKFGYADKNGKPDRLNFGGRHFVGKKCPATGLTMHLAGYDIPSGRITDAGGCIALINTAGDVAASWSFGKILEHWSLKHSKAVYVPSNCRYEPERQYRYGHKVRLAQQTDGLRLLRAFATGAMYYDPGIKLEEVSSAKPKPKKRSQFRVSAKNLPALYEVVETVCLLH